MASRGLPGRATKLMSWSSNLPSRICTQFDSFSTKSKLALQPRLFFPQQKLDALTLRHISRHASMLPPQSSLNLSAKAFLRLSLHLMNPGRTFPPISF